MVNLLAKLSFSPQLMPHMYVFTIVGELEKEEASDQAVLWSV